MNSPINMAPFYKVCDKQYWIEFTEQTSDLDLILTSVIVTLWSSYTRCKIVNDELIKYVYSQNQKTPLGFLKLVRFLKFAYSWC